MKAALKLFANDDRMRNRLEDYVWCSSDVEAGREVIAALNEGGDMAGEFWFELEFFVELMLPVYKLLRMSDGKTRMSKFFNNFLKLPDRWDEICRQQVAASNAHDGQGWKDPVVLERLVGVKEKGARRLEYVWNPMMFSAFALDPEFRSVDLHTINGGQIRVDLHTIYERLLINHGTDSKAAIEAASEEPDGGPVARAGGQFHLFRTGKWKGASLLGYAKKNVPCGLVGAVRHRHARVGEGGHPRNLQVADIAGTGAQLQPVWRQDTSSRVCFIFSFDINDGSYK